MGEEEEDHLISTMGPKYLHTPLLSMSKHKALTVLILSHFCSYSHRQLSKPKQGNHNMTTIPLLTPSGWVISWRFRGSRRSQLSFGQVKFEILLDIQLEILCR